MKLTIKLLFVIALVSVTGRASAQDLPLMPQDPNITTGSMPNGIKYYIVKNASMPGLINYSLIQRGETPLEESREALNRLPHFTEVSPYKFLTRRGVGYKEWGYIDRSRDATFFRFEDLSTADMAVNDSTLMLIFDLCQINPYEQAVIISGDVDPSAVRDRMSVFSMMVSQRQPYLTGTRVTETIKEPFKVESVYDESAVPARISLKIYSARTPSALMGTIQPHMTQYFMYELGLAVQNRLRKSLRDENIPLPRIGFDFQGSLDSDKVDCLTFDIYAELEDVMLVTTILAQTLASMDIHGLSEKEYGFIKTKALMENPKIDASVVVSNDSYMERCASAYLNGASLASAAAVRDFFTSKSLDLATETSLFNSFVSAFVSPDENMVLRYETSSPSVNRDALSLAFRTEWKSDNADTWTMPVNAGDTARFSLPVAKVKMKTESVEPATGGKMWTFSNGIKVIYKNVPGSGRFDYTMLLKGGYASIPDLGDGQGPFIADMLDISGVAGMNSCDFHSLMEANGISVRSKVSTADMRVYGNAPKDKLSLVLGTMAAVAYRRNNDNEAFNYFMRSERLRLVLEQGEEAGYMAMADSIMRPGYKFTPYKYLYGLDNSLQKKASAFFDTQFEKINDGYLIFMGDVDEQTLLRALSRVLGNFRCGKGYSSKPSAQYTMLAGETSILDEGEDGERMQLNISISNMASVSSDRYMAFEMARMALQKGLSRTLGETGMYAEVTGDFEIYPMERLRLTVRCRPCDIDGLPAGINPNVGWKVLKATRNAVTKVCGAPVSEEDLTLYKKLFSVQMGRRLNTPEELSELTVLRYSSNRDFITRYADKINAVTTQDVESILKLLGDGCKVEYNVK